MTVCLRRDNLRSPAQGYTAIELLIVVGLIAVISAISLPLMGQAMADYRISGDARGMSASLTLAKMRAASAASQSRLYFDLEQRAYRVEVLGRGTSPTWTQDGPSSRLATGVTPGFGMLDTPPPDTQPAIRQAAACRTPGGASIGNTACIVFNSRGTPVDAFGAPTSQEALYSTDGTFVYAATVLTSGMVQMWRSSAEEETWSR